MALRSSAPRRGGHRCRSGRLRPDRGGHSRTQDPGDHSHLGRVFHLGWAWVLDPADAWRDEPGVAHCNDQLVDQPVRSYVHRSDRGRRASGRSARSLSAWRHPSRLWIEPTRYGRFRLATDPVCDGPLSSRGRVQAAAGLSLTSINASSDVNSGNSYTLLSVAAVVMGGCALTGGIVAPVGAVIGAVTLSLIGALLGALGVSSDFNAAAQGAVLIALLAMRYLARSEAE